MYKIHEFRGEVVWYAVFCKNVFCNEYLTGTEWMYTVPALD